VEGDGIESGGDLSAKARRKLGSLSGRASETVRDLIRSRGGTASNVNRTGDWAGKTLAEAAQAAVEGDRSAEAAIKIVKQASRLGRRY
jgi:hypothetical protein